MTRKDVDYQIKVLQDKIKELEKIKEISTPEGLADFLHTKMCHHNHTDGCGWFYEKDFNGREHKRWLDKVDRMLKVLNNPEQIALLFEAYLGY